jgi:hypothetical protein
VVADNRGSRLLLWILYPTFTPRQTSSAEAGTVVVGQHSGYFTINRSGTVQPATLAFGITPKF